MKAMKILLVVVVVLLAVPAMAEPTGNDIVKSASGGVSLSTGLGNPVGPSFVDLATDGAAFVKFIWFKDDCTSRAAADTTAQVARKLVIQLRDYTPPRSIYFPSGPDSAYVGLGTATEVVITR